MFKGTAQTSLLMSLLCFTSMSYADSGKQPWQPRVRQKAAAEEQCGRGPKHMRISARHIEGKGIGYNQGYTTLEAFLAPDPETFFIMPFLDLRGHIFDNGKYAANAGIGARWRWGCRAYGINAYYDYRNDRKNYNQASVGLETLGERWDFRINGYLPFGSKITRPYDTRFSHFKGNNLILSRKYEFTMKGADAEAGGHIYCRNFDFFAGAGPYYYEGELGPHAWGGKARLYGMWKEYIGLQVSYSYDNVFRNIVQGEITFSVPLGPRPMVKATNKHCQTTCASAERLDRRMVQPVVRDEIIVLNKHRKHSVAINPATGDPYVFYFVNNTSHSLGTFESPFSTLANAQSAASPWDVIYVLPGNGTSEGMSSGITLKAGQQLLGGTTRHSLATNAGTISIPALASGNLPLLTNTAGNVVTLANNNVISGFYIQNLNGDGIFGSGVNNVIATQNFIQGNGSNYGIELDNGVGTATLSNNTIMTQDACIYLNNTSPVSNATYLITNNTLNNADEDYGLYVNYVEGFNNNLVFSGNQVAAVDEYGVYLSCSNSTSNAAHTFTFTNNQMATDEYPFYLYFAGTVANCTISGNSCISGDYGPYLDLTGAANVSLTMTDNTIVGPYYLGYMDVGDTSTLSANISNNTFQAYSDDDVFYFDLFGAAVADVTFANNAFIGGYGGFDLSNTSTGSPSTFTLTNNLFSALYEYGMYVDSTGSNSIVLEVIGNTFQGFGTNAVNINQGGSGTTCLELNKNSSNVFPNAYLLQQTAGTFNLVAPVGNSGQLTQSGTITPVSSCE